MDFFFCLLLVGAGWLWNAIGVEIYHARLGDPMAVFFAQLAVLIALEIGLHVAIAIQSPRDARTPKDEREKLIDFKASRVAFYVLMAGAWASIATLHVPGSNKFMMAQAMMGSIIITMLVRFAMQIALYRRDA